MVLERKEKTQILNQIRQINNAKKRIQIEKGSDIEMCVVISEASEQTGGVWLEQMVYKENKIERQVNSQCENLQLFFPSYFLEGA